MPRTQPDHISATIDLPESDACYLALKAHDARFDGSFFAAITSTGIYCRPVCRVKMPGCENLRFYRHAAEAEAAGFRPCLRCRPELAPRAASWSTEDASRILSLQAARPMEEPDIWKNTASTASGSARYGGGLMIQIAQKRGVSVRLGWRPPYDIDAMLDFLRLRAIPGVEQVVGCPASETGRRNSCELCAGPTRSLSAT